MLVSEQMMPNGIRITNPEDGVTGLVHRIST